MAMSPAAGGSEIKKDLPWFFLTIGQVISVLMGFGSIIGMLVGLYLQNQWEDQNPDPSRWWMYYWTAIGGLTSACFWVGMYIVFARVKRTSQRTMVARSTSPLFASRCCVDGHTEPVDSADLAGGFGLNRVVDKWRSRGGFSRPNR